MRQNTEFHQIPLPASAIANHLHDALGALAGGDQLGIAYIGQSYCSPNVTPIYKTTVPARAMLPRRRCLAPRWVDWAISSDEMVLLPAGGRRWRGGVSAS